MYVCVGMRPSMYVHVRGWYTQCKVQVDIYGLDRDLRRFLLGANLIGPLRGGLGCS